MHFGAVDMYIYAEINGKNSYKTVYSAQNAMSNAPMLHPNFESPLLSLL